MKVVILSTERKFLLIAKSGISNIKMFCSGTLLSHSKSKCVSISFGITFQFSFQCIFYTDIFLQNVVGASSGEKLGVHLLYILYIKPSNLVLFGALRLIISSGHDVYIAFKS